MPIRFEPKSQVNPISADATSSIPVLITVVFTVLLITPATVSLVISMYVNNVFIVLLFPSVLCEFLNAVARWFPTKILRFTAPWRLFRIDQIAVNLWQSYLVFILVILFFDIVVYIRRGVKDDVL